MTDSAGVSILDVPLLVSAKSYSLADTLALQFPAGHPGFGRVVDGLLQEDGSVLVADVLSSSIYRFGADRALVQEVGRRGQGPGEFGMISGLSRMRSDSVAVGEIGGRRISVLGPDGSFARFAGITLSPTPRPGHRHVSSCCDFAGVLPTGDVLLLEPELVPTSGQGTVEGMVPVVVAPSTGASAQVVFEATGGRHFFQPGDAQAGVSTPVQLTTRAQVTPHRSGFVLIDGHAHALWFFDPSGRLISITRVHVARRPIDRQLRSAVEAHWQQRLTQAGEEATRASGLWAVANAPVADSLPAYTAVRSTLSGEVWAGSEQRASLNLPASYHVFDDAGRLVDAVTLPPRSRLLDASSHHLLVVSRDDLDVDRVFLIER